MDRSKYYKQWSEANPDYKKEYNKEYYQENIQYITEWQALKIECVCGSTIRRGNKARHEKTKKHKLYLGAL